MMQENTGQLFPELPGVFYPFCQSAASVLPDVPAETE